jgi:uncharacterized protein YuzE
MVQSAAEMKINYDRAADVAYVAFGQPREGISVETDNGIVLRVDPNTDEVIGFTVVNFFKRFVEKPNEPVSVPLEMAAACG